MKSIKLFFSLILSCFILTSCVSKKDDDKIVPIDELYKSGLGLLENKKYEAASEEFGKIFFQYPGNNLTAQAELMQSYSLFLASKYLETVDILDLFIKIHPRHEDITYAYYLRALSYYMLIPNVELDQTYTYMAKQYFEEMIKLFPYTKYAIDANLKLDLVNDHIAGKHMDIGRYYLNKNNPIAAINRFSIVIKEYDSTIHVKEALYRMTESYSILGLNDEAKKYEAVLGYNHKDSIWYKYSYNLLNRDKVQKNEDDK
jgi:outer membrane protein assembly factor BamD